MKICLTFRLPDWQQDFDLQGEDHGGDDDGCDSRCRDVGKERRQERARRDDDLKEQQ